MLDLLEKITTGFAGLVVTIIAFLYIYTGVPPTTPAEFLQKVVLVQAPPPAAASPAQGGASAPSPEVEKARAEENEINARLRQQGVQAAGALQRMNASIPPETFEYIKAEANWVNQLKLARSQRIRSPQGTETRLRLDSIAENSLLKVMGLEEGDIIELLDGEIVEFNEHSAYRYRQMFKEKLQLLQQGGTASVTITRQGRPVHLVFSLRR
jgi:hypothetical protein